MAYQRLFVIDADSLVNLLTHYTDGTIDIGAKIVAIATNPMLERLVGLMIEAPQWQDEPREDGSYFPLSLRYQKKQLLKWGEKGTPYDWQREGRGFEIPKRQH